MWWLVARYLPFGAVGQFVFWLVAIVLGIQLLFGGL